MQLVWLRDSFYFMTSIVFTEVELFCNFDMGLKGIMIITVWFVRINVLLTKINEL